MRDTCSCTWHRLCFPSAGGGACSAISDLAILFELRGINPNEGCGGLDCSALSVPFKANTRHRTSPEPWAQAARTLRVARGCFCCAAASGTSGSAAWARLKGSCVCLPPC